MRQKSKRKRPNEIGGDKAWTKINLTAQEKYPDVDKYPEVTGKVLHCYA